MNKKETIKCDICGSSYNKKYDYIFKDELPCFCNIIKSISERDKEIKKLKNEIKKIKTKQKLEKNAE